MKMILDVTKNTGPAQREAKGRLPYWRVLWFDTKLMLLYIPALGLIVFYLSVKRMFPTKAAYYQHKIPAMVARWVLKLNGVTAEIMGMDNLPSNGEAFVIFSNHNSRFDAYIMLASLPFHYKSFWSNDAHVTTEHLFIVEWFGRIFDLFFLHDKKNPRNTVKEFHKAAAFLKRRGVLSFFPEGTVTRGQSQTIDPFGKGCTRLAIDAGVDIVPIVMTNTKYTFERKMRLKAEVKVLIGERISTRGRTKSDIDELTNSVHNCMIEMLNSLNPIRASH